MSFFDGLGNIFKQSASDNFEWQTLSTEEAVDAVLGTTTGRPQIIYKHSSRCGVSYLAQKNLESLSPEMREKADFYKVYVIKQRLISEYISGETGVRHESPQLLIMDDGDIAWSGSHYKVQADAVVTFLKPR